MLVAGVEAARIIWFYVNEKRKKKKESIKFLLHLGFVDLIPFEFMQEKGEEDRKENEFPSVSQVSL